MKLSLCLALAVTCVLGSQAFASPDKGGVIALSPSPSPNGQEIAFTADFDGSSRLWVARLDGGKLRQVSPLTDGLGATAHLEPAWSPDGRSIAFMSLGESGSDIWVAQANGSYPVRLTFNGLRNEAPAWSPDGSKIVFSSGKDGTNDIWVMNADGTRQTKVFGSEDQENSPKFSPSGNDIVFSRNTVATAALWIVNANGTGPRQITNTSGYDLHPSWSDRGIVFSSDRDSSSGDLKVWIVQPDGSGLRKVGDFDGRHPAWLPDGRIVVSDDGVLSAGALSFISMINPVTAQKRVVVDVQGYFTPIDIRPGRSPNNVNPMSSGRIPVAILSTRTVDAKTVDRSTVSFGRTGSEGSLATCDKSLKDVNGDGLPDLTCRFAIRHAGFLVGTPKAC